MYKRIISALLICAMLLSSVALTSCSDNGASSTDESAAEDSQSPTAEEEAAEVEADSLDSRRDVSDNLPEKDFGGKDFHIAGDDGYEEYYTQEELTGDVVDDAIYQRNLDVSERFNVTISADVYEESSITSQVKNSVLAGDDAYQLMAGHVIYMGMAVTDNIMYDMASMPYIDFTQPWWSSSTVDDLTYKGMTFLAVGDFAMSSILETYCMYYNKDLASQYGLPDMYELVNSGDWTIDKMEELSDGVYTDTNGDGERNIGDIFALSTSTKSAANAWLWALGKKIATQQEDGSYEVSYFDEKVVSLFEKLYSLYFETDIVYYEANSHDTTLAFYPGQALFSTGTFRQATGDYRDVEFDYGIIPYPKWDTAQESYYTSVDGGHEALCVPKGITDPEFIGIILEALCAESWKQTVPAYYDTALKFKGARDYESIAMIDMIMDSRVFDFGYVYGGWGPVFWIQYELEAKSKDITSYYEKNHKVFDKYMEKVYEAFDKYAEEG